MNEVLKGVDEDCDATAVVDPTDISLRESKTSRFERENIPTMPVLLPQHKDEETRVMLVICTDGVWEYCTGEEVMELCVQRGKEKAKDSTDKIAKIAAEKWFKETEGFVIDDITAMVVYI